MQFEHLSVLVAFRYFFFLFWWKYNSSVGTQVWGGSCYQILGEVIKQGLGVNDSRPRIGQVVKGCVTCSYLAWMPSRLCAQFPLTIILLPMATNQPQYSRRVLVEADEGRPRLVGVDGGGHEGGKGGDDGSEVDFEVHPALLRHPIACTLLSWHSVVTAYKPPAGLSTARQLRALALTTTPPFTSILPIVSGIILRGKIQTYSEK